MESTRLVVGALFALGATALVGGVTAIGNQDHLDAGRRTPVTRPIEMIDPALLPKAPETARPVAAKPTRVVAVPTTGSQPAPGASPKARIRVIPTVPTSAPCVDRPSTDGPGGGGDERGVAIPGNCELSGASKYERSVGRRGDNAGDRRVVARDVWSRQSEFRRALAGKMFSRPGFLRDMSRQRRLADEHARSGGRVVAKTSR